MGHFSPYANLNDPYLKISLSDLVPISLESIMIVYYKQINPVLNW